MLGICTAVLVAAALHVTQPVLAPVAFALFVIALVWPAQRALQGVLPRPLALLVTVLGTIAVMATLVLTVLWGGGRIGQWLVSNAGRLQGLYLEKAAWLEGHGVEVAGLFAEHFDVRWLVGLAQGLSGRRAS
jgi:AI-2 transport protein TqsA